MKILKKIFSRHKKRAAIADSSLGAIGFSSRPSTIELKSSAFEISKIGGALFSPISRRVFLRAKNGKSLLILLAGNQEMVFSQDSGNLNAVQSAYWAISAALLAS